MLEKKIYVLGDKSCGKSSLLEALTGQTPVPRGKNNKGGTARRCTEVTVPHKIKREGCCKCFSGFRGSRLATKQEKVTMIFKECEESEGRLRAMNYLDTDVILICFDVTSHSTLNNVKDMWLPEAKYYSPVEVPIILVGLKSDVNQIKRKESTAPSKETLKRRASSLFGRRVLDPTQRAATKLASEQSIFAYIVCSARDKRGIESLKQTISMAASMQATRCDSHCDYRPTAPLDHKNENSKISTPKVVSYGAV